MLCFLGLFFLAAKPYKILKGIPIRNTEKAGDFNLMTKDRILWIISGLDWDRLTRWEENFVERMEIQFKEEGDLTRGQEEKLEEIYREKSK